MADDGSDSLTGVPGSVLGSPSTSESQIETVGSSHFPPSERRLPLARVHNPGLAGNGSEQVMSEREVVGTGTNWGEAFLGLKALARAQLQPTADNRNRAPAPPALQVFRCFVSIKTGTPAFSVPFVKF